MEFLKKKQQILICCICYNNQCLEYLLANCSRLFCLKCASQQCNLTLGIIRCCGCNTYLEKQTVLKLIKSNDQMGRSNEQIKIKQFFQIQDKKKELKIKQNLPRKQYYNHQQSLYSDELNNVSQNKNIYNYQQIRNQDEQQNQICSQRKKVLKQTQTDSILTKDMNTNYDQVQQEQHNYSKPIQNSLSIENEQYKTKNIQQNIDHSLNVTKILTNHLNRFDEHLNSQHQYLSIKQQQIKIQIHTLLGKIEQDLLSKNSNTTLKQINIILNKIVSKGIQQSKIPQQKKKYDPLWQKLQHNAKKMNALLQKHHQ